MQGREVSVLRLTVGTEWSGVLMAVEKEPEFEAENTQFIRVAPGRAAFHERREKNSKVVVREGRRDKMMKKYKKPITRGQKPKGKKKK